jgi:hypothetical protein
VFHEIALNISFLFFILDSSSTRAQPNTSPLTHSQNTRKTLAEHPRTLLIVFVLFFFRGPSVGFKKPAQFRENRAHSPQSLRIGQEVRIRGRVAGG